MIRPVLVLFVILATVCATEEIATITRRGSVATVEEETSLGRRQLLDWGWLLFHLGIHPVDCCKPQPPIGPAHHEWGRICPDLGCQDSTSELYSAESAEAAVESEVSSSSGGSIPTASAVSYWPLVVAAMAATTAVIAGLIGQRREKAGNHQLRGSVARRMDMFSAFANNALCGQTGTVPGVELAPPKDYRMV